MGHNDCESAQECRSTHHPDQGNDPGDDDDEESDCNSAQECIPDNPPDDGGSGGSGGDDGSNGDSDGGDGGSGEEDSEEPPSVEITELSGPDGSTTDESSELSATVSTDGEIESVKFTITKRVDSTGETTDSEEYVSAPSEGTVSVNIDNTVLGAASSSITVEYGVNATAKDGSTIGSVVHDPETYVYEPSDADVLYVPVTFESGDNAEPRVDSTLEERADKTSEYYSVQSNGEVDITHHWAVDSIDDPYFVLPDDRLDYREGTDNENYSHKKIVCDGYDELITNHVEPNDYDHLAFVAAEQDNEFLRGMAWYGNPCERGNANNVVIMSTKVPYSTWAHEFGHAKFGWADYYGGENAQGQIDKFGIMGQNRNPSSPPPVMPKHRLDEGWSDQTTIPSVSEDYRSSYAHLEWLYDGGEVAKFEPSTHNSEDSIYEHVLISARDTDNNPVPPHSQGGYIDYTNDEDPTQNGLNVYLVSSSEPGRPAVDRVDNPTTAKPDHIEDDLAERTVSIRSRWDDTVHDPDLGYKIQATDETNRDVGVNVTYKEETNIEGINIYTHFPCEERANNTGDGECDAHINDGSAPENQSVPAVTARFETENGTLGQYANGTGVNTVEEGTHLNAGSIQKLYVPQSSDAELNVTTNPDANANVQVTTQVVTRDAEGNRTASDLQVQNVSEDGSFDPELARLNTSQQQWDAGELPTKETNSTTLHVENNGIQSLENVTVETDSEWVTANQTSLRTVENASTVPIELTTEVPGGAPAGNYTVNVTVAGTGTAEHQTKQIPVNVTVLPTARWDATVADANQTIATNDTTTTTIEVSNDEGSNIPIEDVDTTITGDVTSLDVDSPTTVERLAPGESANQTLAVSVPAEGIEAGEYDGSMTIEPAEYGPSNGSVPVPSDYDVVEPAAEQTTFTVDVHGPSTNASASFNPERQPEQRMGTTTQQITVDVEDTTHDVRAESVDIRTTILEGWSIEPGNGAANGQQGQGEQKAKGKNKGPNSQNGNDKQQGKDNSQGAAKGPDKPKNSDDHQRGPGPRVTVWVVEEASTETGGDSTVERTKLDPDDYSLVQQNDTVAIVVDDITQTRSGEYMSSDHRLEAELKLQKDRSAESYEYAADVTVEVQSPVEVSATHTTKAEIDVFEPGNENSTGPGNAGQNQSGNSKSVAFGNGQFAPTAQTSHDTATP